MTPIPASGPPRARKGDKTVCRIAACARTAAVAAALAGLAACAGGQGRRGVVEGVVVDQAGRGIAGVAVALSGAAASEMRTDAQGRYSFRRLAAGQYRVSLNNPPGSAVPQQGVRPAVVGERRRSRVDFAVLPANLTRIAEIQGRGHLSPYARRDVASVPGIVTVLRPRAGFYMQSPLPDSSPDTSEGLFVAVSRMPDLAPGDLVLVDGRVEEHVAAGAESRDLPVTRLVLASYRRLGRGFDVPEPVILGEGGRLPPDRVICNDADGNAEQSPFDPVEDGLDFYESLEGMLVQVNNALVAGSLRPQEGEFEVVGDGGRRATALSARGALVLLAGDQNPERITVDLKGDPDVIAHQIPSLTVGDRFSGAIVGPLDYGGSAYKILPSRPLPPVVKANLPRQIAALRGDERTLACAVLNAHGFAPGSSREKAADLAETIVRALHSPAIVALLEVQDDSGRSDNGTVSAEKNARLLLEAIRTAGGPATYRWRDIPPANNADGGEPGANIRAGFLYDRERVQLVERMGANSRTPLLVRESSGRPELSFSPGLIGLDDPAFRASRKPLAAEFMFRGRRLFVAAAHLVSRVADPPPFGRVQPLQPASEAARLEQAKALNRFASAILALDRDADLIILGNFNAPAWSPSMLALKGQQLFDLAEQRLPPEERYTSVHRGNALDLDHVFVSKSLLERADARLEIVHRYAEYAPDSRHSDHDPVLASFRFR